MKTLNERLAWLAGIIDGEGFMCAQSVASSHVKKDGTKGRQLIFTVGIGNTDYSMIREIVSISRDAGIECIVTMQKPKCATRHKMAWKVRWHGWGRVEAVLRPVLPYLINKKGRAELMLAMIAHRRTTAVTLGKRGKQGFSDDEWLATQLSELKFLNRRGPAPVEECLNP